MSISQSRIIGKKGSSIKKLRSTSSLAYYRIVSTTHASTFRAVYADSAFCAIRVKENTPVEFVNIAFSASDPNDCQCSIIFDGATLANTGIVVDPSIISPINGSGIISNFDALGYDLASFSGPASSKSAYRDMIVAIDPDDVVSIQDPYSAGNTGGATMVTKL